MIPTLHFIIIPSLFSSSFQRKKNVPFGEVWVFRTKFWEAGGPLQLGSISCNHTSIYYACNCKVSSILYCSQMNVSRDLNNLLFFIVCTFMLLMKFWDFNIQFGCNLGHVTSHRVWGSCGLFLTASFCQFWQIVLCTKGVVNFRYGHHLRRFLRGICKIICPDRIIVVDTKKRFTSFLRVGDNRK